MQTFIEKDPSVFFKLRFLDIYMAGHNGFIAGGCFKNIFQNVRIKDIDLFFESEMDFTNANIYFKGNADYTPSYENKNTIAYKNVKTNMRVELVRSQYGTPQEIISKFDFSIVKFSYFRKKVVTDEGTSISFSCLYHTDFFEHLVLKKLVLEREILFPVSTFERSYRYTKYGFGLCRESKENLLNAIKGVEAINISNDLYFGFD